MTWWWRIRCDACKGFGFECLRGAGLLDCRSCGGPGFLIERPDGTRRRESQAEREERLRAWVHELLVSLKSEAEREEHLRARMDELLVFLKSESGEAR